MTATTAAAAERRTLLWLLFVAALIRLYVAIAWPSLHHPDENFQSLEQAHRFAFGYGVTPWEFHEGVRSTLIPWLVSRLFVLVGWFSSGPEPYLLAAHVLYAALSLTIVVAAYRAGQRFSPRHALIAGLVAATWFQIVNFADRTLSEAIAANFLVLAVALGAAREPGREFRRQLLVGACLALCVAIRTDLAPGALVVACWSARFAWREGWWPLVIGALPVLALFGASDWVAWGTPFHSYYTLFRRDLLQGVLSTQGTEPFDWLFDDLGARWDPAALLLVALVVLALRRHALWVLAAAAIFLVHSCIAHKEYRYVFPAVACLAIGAALASADVAQALEQSWNVMRPRLVSSLLAASWVALSVALALTPVNAQDWRSRADHIRLSFWLYRQPELCGLLLYDYAWFNTGGYAYLHRRIPMYEWLDHSSAGQMRALSTAASVANFVLLKRSSLPQLAPLYQLRHCDFDRGGETMCVAERPGSCAPLAGVAPVH